MSYQLYDIYSSLINKPKMWLYYTYTGKRFSDKDKSIIGQFALPNIESGIVNVVEKVFRCKIDGRIDITSKDVKDADEAELKVYSKYKTINYNVLDLPVFLKTVEFVYNAMGLNNLKKYIMTVDNAIDSLPSDGNSGYPFYIKKGNEKAISRVKEDLNRFMLCKTFNDKIKFLVSHPTVIFHRFTPKVKDLNGVKSNKFKIRHIWGVPYLIILLERIYFDKFVRQFKESMSSFYTSGRTKLEISELVKTLREKAKRENKIIMCGDIKGCDKSVPSCFFQLFAFMLKKSISGNASECQIIDLLLKYLCFTPYLGHDGKTYYTHGSTVSGSYITSLFTTFVVFFALSYTYFSKYNTFPTLGDLLVQGDDFVILINDEKEAENIKLLLKTFNLRLNLSATSIVNNTEDIDFLGFYWNDDCEPDQIDNWIIARTVFPERYVPLAGPDRSITRYLSLIFQLRRSRTLFKLFYNFDKYMRRKFCVGGNSTLYIIDSRGKIHINRIPIIKYINLGWKMF